MEDALDALANAGYEMEIEDHCDVPRAVADLNNGDSDEDEDANGHVICSVLMTPDPPAKASPGMIVTSGGGGSPFRIERDNLICSLYGRGGSDEVQAAKLRGTFEKLGTWLTLSSASGDIPGRWPTRGPRLFV